MKFVHADWKNKLLSIPGIGRLVPTGELPKQFFNELTGKWEDRRTEEELQRVQEKAFRRQTITVQHLRSGWSCLQCKRRCRGDGSTDLEMLLHNQALGNSYAEFYLPTIQRYRLTGQSADAELTRDFSCRPEDLMEDRPEFLFCGKCGGALILWRKGF